MIEKKWIACCKFNIKKYYWHYNKLTNQINFNFTSSTNIIQMLFKNVYFYSIFSINFNLIEFQFQFNFKQLN